jgi:hypothetical protein
VPFPEKPWTRRSLGIAMPIIVATLLTCVAWKYFLCTAEHDDDAFLHLFEIFVVMYGTILGLYFGAI